ncbi:MAG: Asp-tRNA(Asn)/Glu-tRNA(Gln) amidotransferase GatCAB subunit C [Alphaproteobacteria bacterium]|nr:MAG: Asp-tRNA(Asn)/Glu-tRNA(Gln) amidotransferase GatCAB subunit C [Alphaproteobacteria bacterium]
MKHYITATHWGAYKVGVEDNKIVTVDPVSTDPEPSAIGRSLVESCTHKVRIEQPMVREGWLNDKKTRNKDGRGRDAYVAVSWETATKLVADELKRVKGSYGNSSIFAGSYGWASAGRFHHAQSQMRRFLNLFGGHTNTVNTYSFAAAEVIVPHIVGSFYEVLFAGTTVDNVAEHGELVVAFGGWPLKNSQVNAGGVSRHEVRPAQKTCKEAGVEFVCLGPNKDDMADFLEAEWLQVRPTTDTAVMLGLAHVLYEEDLYDADFLSSHCVGFEPFKRYLLGTDDGMAKDADWASEISGLSSGAIRRLARKMAKRRTFLTASWSLQRAEYGEQPYWMLIVLASMLGQIGLPGAGFGFGHSAAEGIGTRWDHPIRPGSFPVPENLVRDVFPVSRISDLLLNPGGTCDFDGKALTFPDTKLVYWCGGNPFHHHQDINRLVKAWRRPDTIIVHEPWWTSTARHSDIILPCTTTLERNDFTVGHCDWSLQVMQQAVTPHGSARNEYDIFSDLADALGFKDSFTEGRDEKEWLSLLYDQTRESAAEVGAELPDFQDFWQKGEFRFPPFEHPKVLFKAFRDDPQAHPLATPSGKIEIFSETIKKFGYADCPPHPTWIEPREWLGSPRATVYPFHLISNQPKDKLHSQLDFSLNSRDIKVRERTPLWISPEDAEKKNLTDCDIVRVYNDRGACLAGVIISEDVQKGVLILPTGSWYDPEEPGELGSLDVHGNPNILTRDVGTSKLSQGPSAQSCLVDIEKYDKPLPKVKIHEPPKIIRS